MSLTVLMLALILLSVAAVAVVVLVVVPVVVDNAVVIRLSQLRERLHDLDTERPGTLKHSDVERLDRFLYNHMMTPRIPLHVAMGAAAVVARAKAQGRAVEEPRAFKGLELDHQNDLRNIEIDAIYFIMGSVLLAPPIWVVTWPLWLIVRYAWRQNAAQGKRRRPVQRRAEAFVVFVGDLTDFEGWGVSRRRDGRMVTH